MFAVSLLVTCNLGAPKLVVGRRKAPLRTVVAVPEAPMDKNDCPVAWEDDVRFAGQIFPVQAKPVAEPMEKTSYDALRSGIAASHATHQTASRFWTHDVSHCQHLKKCHARFRSASSEFLYRITVESALISCIDLLCSRCIFQNASPRNGSLHLHSKSFSTPFRLFIYCTGFFPSE